MICQNPGHKIETRDETGRPVTVPYDIPTGDRSLRISPLAVNWGTDDLRDDWQGDYTFCSFKCLKEWADAKAADHDGRTVKEGT